MSNAAPMSTGKRFLNYESQRGALLHICAPRLTGPQHRRLIHKENRRLAQRRKANAEAIRLEKANTPAIRPCGGSEYCITGSGNKARSIHKKCEVAA
ncbi:hypothetical protein [Spirillospora sp. CA-294931]|uniref:hypothetical protein n=1 Tax=Spirillospora sp. CA-294931 TaxID=3240042 RepID=UPI003D91FA3A